MKGKAALVVGLATGYVLGTRDGRERYEQIKSQATRLWNDPRVQEKATAAQELAKDKASSVAGKASSGTSSSSDPGPATTRPPTQRPTPTSSTPSTPPPAATTSPGGRAPGARTGSGDGGGHD